MMLVCVCAWPRWCDDDPPGADDERRLLGGLAGIGAVRQARSVQQPASYVAMPLLVTHPSFSSSSSPHPAGRSSLPAADLSGPACCCMPSCAAVACCRRVRG